MKAIILAGGFAKRMWPLTKDYPKVLLPVKGRPVIEHIMEKLENLSDIDSVHVSTNQRFEKDFREWINRFSEKTNKKINLVVEPARKEEEKLGSIGALKFFIEKEGIDDDLLIVGGDNLFGFSLEDFVNFFKEKRTPVMAFFDMENPEKVRGKYGVCVLDEHGKVIEFQEKPDSPKSTLASTAVYLFPKEMLNMIHEYIEGKNNPDALGFFIEWLKDKTTVHGFTFKEKWFDIGTHETYQEAIKSFESHEDN
ncbi:MAG: nucleotidyltransferase family protein [Candidatus Aenigmatarchaeota archaeon]|nr:MAG: nucleotidyltransferase family protein [Candidatus Aenigmarchaeota archaeon]